MLESSMDYWWPLARDSGLLAPPTTRLGFREGFDLSATLHANWTDKLDDIFDSEAVGAINGAKYPAFLRSDQMAAKHSWKDTCYVRSPADVLAHSFRIAEEAYMADLHTSSFYLRELISTDSAFPAFSGQMPITTEARTFIRDGKLDCMHPYWPIESVGQWADTRILKEYSDAGISPSPERQKQFERLPRTWKHKMRLQHKVVDKQRPMLEALAYCLGEYLQTHSHISYWSADFLLASSGMWYLTDMACGIESYHWPDCERAVNLDNWNEEVEKLLHETKRRDSD